MVEGLVKKDLQGVQSVCEYSPELKARLLEVIPFDSKTADPYDLQDSFLNAWDSGTVSVLQDGRLYLQDESGDSQYLALTRQARFFRRDQAEIWDEAHLGLAREIVFAETFRLEVLPFLTHIETRIYAINLQGFDASDPKQFHELQSLQQSLDEFENRRQNLQSQGSLMVSEREQLVVLNGVADKIWGLQLACRDLFEKGRVQNHTILRRHDLVTLIRLQEPYGFESLDIVKSLFNSERLFYNYRLYREPNHEEVEVLSNLKFTNEAIAECRLREGSVILQYVNLPEVQKKVLQDRFVEYYKEVLENLDEETVVDHGILFEPNYDEDGVRQNRDVRKKIPVNRERSAEWIGLDGLFFGELLSKGVLGDAGIEIQIQILEKYFLEFDREPAYAADFLLKIDLLASESLALDCKKRLATVLVECGSGLDCDYLLRFHSELLSEQDKIKAEEKKNQNIYTALLQIPNLYEANPEDFSEKNVHVITHPWYAGFANFTESNGKHLLWEDWGEDGFVYFEKSMALNLNEAFANQNDEEEEFVHERYLQVLESLEEFDHYQNLLNDPDAVIVLILPKRYGSLEDAQTDPTLKGYLALIDLLNQMGVDNVYYVESFQSNTGALKQHDEYLLDLILPDTGSLFMSGGYVKDCLYDSVRGLAKVSQDNSRFIIEEMKPSTRHVYGLNKFNLDTIKSVFGRYSETAQLTEVAAANFHETHFQVVNPLDEIQTLDDVRGVIEHNKNFNDAYQRYTQMEYEVFFDPFVLNGVHGVVLE